VSKQLSFIQHDKPEKEVGFELYFDGAARNNPGPAGAGIVIKQSKQIIAQYGFYLGNKTNNQAEYLALVLGLIAAHEHTQTNKKITIYSDSELLVRQFSGQYRVKNPVLNNLFNVAYVLSKELTVSFKHISRIYNTEADQLANNGIDKKNPIPEHYKRVLDEFHITL
jgi:ribonuclease HI